MDWRFLKLKKPRIAVVGDAMLDLYVFCEAYGLTPEDPIAPKLRLQHTQERLGGAANVAANLVSLGAETTLLSVRGDDVEGKRLEDKLRAVGVTTNLSIVDRPTTSKMRIIAYPKDRLKRKVVHPEGRYICRVDTEEVAPIDRGAIEAIELSLKTREFDMIVVSDYNKGVVGLTLMKSLQGKPYVVDPKRKNLSFYGQALVLTPNAAEAEALDTGDHLSQVMMVTVSGRGSSMLAFGDVWKLSAKELLKFSSPKQEYSKFNAKEIPVRYRTEGDATGCGDSAIAGLAFGLGSGLKLIDAAYLSMACGACAVDHEGVKAIPLDDVITELSHKEYEHES